ncbi:MAG: thermonuclease family protein [Pseudomonadota bacterium]
MSINVAAGDTTRPAGEDGVHDAQDGWGRACYTPSGRAHILAHDGGLSFTLDDGRELRLADLSLPHNQVSVSDEAGWREQLIGQNVGVYQSVGAAENGDRYGRLIGDLRLPPHSNSLLATVLSEGLALVDPAHMSGVCVDALFVAEGEAESGRRGLWSTPNLVRDADDGGLADEAGIYVIVEGLVKSVGETSQTTYLNFGDEYRTDFTALARRGDTKGWTLSLPSLKGERVRLRGVLEAWNGGMIRLEHQRQVEVLQAPRLGR